MKGNFKKSDAELKTDVLVSDSSSRFESELRKREVYLTPTLRNKPSIPTMTPDNCRSHPYANRMASGCAWQVQVGRVKLYLLDEGLWQRSLAGIGGESGAGHSPRFRRGALPRRCGNP